MTKREKQGAIIAGLSLLALGTAFAYFGKKKECALGETYDEETGECKPIDLIPADPRVTPGDCPPGHHWSGSPSRGKCVPDEVKPDPSDVDDLIKIVPQGSHFYRVKKGDVLGYGTSGTYNLTNPGKGLPIAVWYIRREAHDAAMAIGGLSDEAAWAWVNNNFGGNKVIAAANAALDVILCSAFNDACYATWGYCGQPAINAGRCPSTMRNHPGPTGRAIRLLPYHPDNIARIRQGQVVARYIAIGSAGNAGDGRGTNKANKKGFFEQLWIPKLDHARLWATTDGVPGHTEIEASPETWDDGSPLSSPPPWIMRGGELLDFSGTLNLPSAFGCAGESMNMRFGG